MSIAVGDAGGCTFQSIALPTAHQNRYRISPPRIAMSFAQSLLPKELSRKDVVIGLLLVLTMLVTRSHHFGTAFSPPDASLAVFFLAGLWIASGWIFGTLIVVAALADQMAFAAGVSDWCRTA